MTTPAPLHPYHPLRWPWNKKDKSPRTLYAKLCFTETPFEDGNKEQRKCILSFRILDTVGVFPCDAKFVESVKEGIVHHSRRTRPIHFRIVVYPRPYCDYIYTGALQIGVLEKDASPPKGVALTEGNRWTRTVGTNLETVSEGIARMFVGHPKVHRFLFGAEQKR